MNLRNPFRRAAPPALLAPVVVESKAITVESFAPGFFDALNSISGPAVTPVSALKVPAVAAAVQLISGAIGTMPARLEITGEVDQVHPAHGLISVDANEWTSADQLRQQLTQDALMHGDGLAYVNRVASRPVELIRLAPGTVTISYDIATGEPSYRLGLANGGQRLYSHQDVLHIRSPISIDGVTGASPIHLAKEAIGLALVLEQHAAKLFGNGARPSGVLKFPNKLSAEVAARIRDAWHQAHAGASAGRTAVLEEGGDFTPLTFSSVDAQFAELRAFQTVEIARAFRIPPHMLFEMQRATWSNAEQGAREFYSTTLLPWLKAWEAAYRRVLLTAEERSSYAITFDVDELLRGDTATRGAFYAAMRSTGTFTANEVRAWEGLPPLPDGNTLASPHTTSSSAPAGDPAPAKVNQ